VVRDDNNGMKNDLPFEKCVRVYFEAGPAEQISYPQLSGPSNSVSAHLFFAEWVSVYLNLNILWILHIKRTGFISKLSSIYQIVVN
jgi:hypothetical protein